MTRAAFGSRKQSRRRQFVLIFIRIRIRVEAIAWPHQNHLRLYVENRLGPIKTTFCFCQTRPQSHEILLLHEAVANHPTGHA